MSIYCDFTSLTPLRKHQQIMAFFLIFVNAMMIAITTILYIEVFGAEGMILKNYAISLYGLILLVPMFGRFAIANPLTAFKIAIAFEILSIVCYLFANNSVAETVTLPLGSVFVISSGLLMRPILTQAESIVTAGCGEYSLLKAKLDSVYTAIGAFFGGFMVLMATPITVMIGLFAFTLIFARYYRKLVLDEIFGEQATDEPIIDITQPVTK